MAEVQWILVSLGGRLMRFLLWGESLHPQLAFTHRFILIFPPQRLHQGSGMLCEISYVDGIPLSQPDKAAEPFWGDDMLLFPLPDGSCPVGVGESHPCTKPVPDLLQCVAEKRTFFRLDSQAGFLKSQKKSTHGLIVLSQDIP